MGAITESDVRATYAKLRALMSDAAPPVSKRTEIETLANCLYDFVGNNVDAYDKRKQTPNNLERYAVEALAEGHVELFEKVADWCRLFSAKEQSDLGPWSRCLHLLYRTTNFRACNSLKLSNRLAKSKHYVRMVEMHMRWNIKYEKELTTAVRNNLFFLNYAPEATVTLRGLYPIILEIYNTKK